MNIYSFDEIKARGDCIRYMTEIIGAQAQGSTDKEWVEFNSPFRAGSDSKAFKVSRVGFHDFVTEDTGSIIDLCMLHKNCEMFEAADFLGQWLCLEPTQRMEQPKTLTATYQYRDRDGAVVHETLRFETADGKKTIRQRRPDPAAPWQYINSLDGIAPVLYRWPEWHESESVIVVEGEKCADTVADLGLPATTNAMGAGKWLPHYTDALRGKRVFLVPDNDEPGEAHMANVAAALIGAAAEVHIVKLPGLAIKEDIYEWVHVHGHTKADLVALCKATPAVTPEQLNATAMPTVKQITEAKKANETPFSNYDTYVDGEDKKGEPVYKKRPVIMTRLLNDLFRRFWAFPRRVGSCLFDHDRKTGAIRLIATSDELFAWIHEKSGHPVNWAHKLEGSVTPGQFYSSVLHNAQRYDAISCVPAWPMRDDVYYTFGKMPEPTPDRRYFDQFVSFFSFATDEDRNLFRVLCASAIYYRPKVDRPLWVIDSTDGQGSGKSRCAEALAYLVGGKDPETSEPMWFKQSDFANSFSETVVHKRILSSPGRKKRVLIIDNVVGHFKSSTLSTLITQGSISGMAPYGHGEETRPNDITCIITVNSAQLDSDGADRCFQIFVKKPIAPPPDWASQLFGFIDANRLQIIADIIGTIETGKNDAALPRTRFRSWEVEIMAAVLTTEETDAAWKQNEDRKRDSNTDMDEASVIEEFVREKIDSLLMDGSKKNVWLTNRLVSSWCNEAITGFGGEHGRNAVARIKNMVKARQSAMFSYLIQRKQKLRGIMWHGDKENPTISVHYLIDMGANNTVRTVRFEDELPSAPDLSDQSSLL